MLKMDFCDIQVLIKTLKLRREENTKAWLRVRQEIEQEVSNRNLWDTNQETTQSKDKYVKISGNQ